MTAEGLDAAFRKASELAATFQANESRYLSADYQEAEARKDFIDKFFIALGWDVNHDVQRNPYAQEVKVEVAHGSSQRRADYAFYIAPNFGDSDVRFYVEAKKPHGNIATADNYFQTIRYGSGSRTPLAVLTDFEQFHVLDSRFKADICRSLSDEYSPYNFATIPIPILGSIYERFLGKVIVATDKRVRVEEKPEVRKAGGVYYTPEYIVRYLVENTVGKLIAGKTPDQIAEMHFADIACGSGSFLLGIYDLLLQYHGNYYNALTGEQRFNCYDPRFLLGVLNSRLMQRLWTERFYDQRRTFPKIKGTYLEQLPIRRISFSTPADRTRHDEIVQNVEALLAVKQQLAKAKTDKDKTYYENKCAALDRQIDRLVYDLYGLTEDEIGIVESAK